MATPAARLVAVQALLVLGGAIVLVLFGVFSNRGKKAVEGG